MPTDLPASRSSLRTKVIDYSDFRASLRTKVIDYSDFRASLSVKPRVDSSSFHSKTMNNDARKPLNPLNVHAKVFTPRASMSMTSSEEFDFDSEADESSEEYDLEADEFIEEHDLEVDEFIEEHDIDTFMNHGNDFFPSYPKTFTASTYSDTIYYDKERKDS